MSDHAAAPAAIYLGVGVSEYDHHQELPCAVADVTAIGAALQSRGYTVSCVANPDEGAATTQIKQILAADVLAEGGALVVVWCGHGEPAPEGRLVLVARDTASGAAPLLTPEYLAGVMARTGASQALLVLDACYSGGAMIDATAVANRVKNELPPAAARAWFGVLASALPLERARDGLFGAHLVNLLRDGPRDPELQRRWSAHNAGVRGDDLIDALLKEWDSDAQHPDAASAGNAWVMLPNPSYDPDAPARVVEHLLLAARGVDPGEEGVFFNGRDAQIVEIVKWMHSGRPGVCVVTGPGGSGKSAIVGRIVSLSHPHERAELLEHDTLGPADPGEAAVAAHVHARGLTSEAVVEHLDEQLVAARVLEPHARGRRNRGQLLGDLEAAGATPAIAIDGLDEAGTEAWAIAEDVLRLLAGTAQLLVATRSVPDRAGERTLVDALAPRVVIDLGEQELGRQTAVDVRGYVRRRLAGFGEPEMDSERVAEAIVRLGVEHDEGLFLLARVVTAQLRREPVDTSAAGWEDRIAGSVEEALERDLSRIPPLMQPGGPLPQASAELLAALAWGYGAGVPDDIWPIIASELSAAGTSYDRDDVFWLLGQAGRYIVEDGDDGRAVYRLSHQLLASHLGGPARSRATTPTALPAAELTAARIAAALVQYYQRLLAAGLPPTAHAYLWHHAWRHCADGGMPGIGALRELAGTDAKAFLPHLATALNNLGNRYAATGRHGDAVAPAEEAVTRYRELAAENRAHLPNLAMALNNLAVRYAETGRHGDAVAPAEEAVTRYRELAAENRAHLPDLAMALTNLGSRYAEIGRHGDAVAATEEAVTRYREQAAANPAHRPNLAMALTNLGSHYAETGRHGDAAAPTAEAVGVSRQLAAENPAYLPTLAMALNNLGVRYGETGRHGDAVSPTEEAVDLYREQAAANPAHLHGLAGALTNLASHYNATGRSGDAVAPAEAAVTLYRKLAANPAHLPGLAAALTNLSNHYAATGRRGDAAAPAEEAVALYREQAAENRAYLPDLGSALINLGNRYANTGRRGDATAATEAAVALSRQLAAENRAYLPNLAMALNNLGIRYAETGRRGDAVSPTEEAVTLYREQAAENAAYLPDLAGALDNLGTLYLATGRHGDAVSPTEEAVTLYREQAAENRAYLPGLALALNNLGTVYAETGRHGDAVSPSEEAVTLYHEQATENPAYLPDLAGALNNLGSCYTETGRRGDAVAPTEAAVALYHQQAAKNTAHLPNLAAALNNLGTVYSATGRRGDAVAPTEAAVARYRELAAENHAYLPSLAMALNNLGNRWAQIGRPAVGELKWQEVIRSVPQHRAKAELLMHHALRESTPTAAAVTDLTNAISLLATDDHELLASLRTAARSLRERAADAFDALWSAQAGPPPPWLRVTNHHIERVVAWLAAKSEHDAHRFISAHADELLNPATDIALDEMSLQLDDPTELDPARELVREARRVGIDEAYRSRLAYERVGNWLAADRQQQRDMLHDSRTRAALLDHDAQAAVTELRQLNPEDANLSIGEALLTLASRDDHDEAFDALAGNSDFHDLLVARAQADAAKSLAATATIAAHAGATEREQASGWFHHALALNLSGEHEHAREAARHARTLDPSQTASWLAELTGLAPHHPGVISLTQPLIEDIA